MAAQTETHYLAGFGNGEGPVIWTCSPNKAVNGYLSSWGGWDRYKFHMTPPAKFEDGKCSYIEEDSIINLRAMHYPVNIIDFSKIGIDYQSRDLYGKGFQLNVSGSGLFCRFAFYFLPGTDVAITSSGGMNPTFKIMVGVDNVQNGHQLADRIVNIMGQDDGIKNSNAVFASTYINDYPLNENCFVFWNVCHFSESDGFIAESLWDAIELKAEYTGPDIKVNSQYNKSDVKVTIIYTETITEELTVDDWVESSLDVTKVGVNTYTATYQGLSAGYTVNGIKTIYKIEVEYTGPAIHVYNDYNKKDVQVRVYYKNDPLVYELWPISKCNISGTYVTQDGENWYSLSIILDDGSTMDIENKFDYSVPGVGISHLFARYDGPEIWKNHEYSLDDVYVSLVYLDNCVEELKYTDCIFNPDLVIHQPYNNEYEVSYIDKGGNTWSAKYVIVGIAIEKVEAEYTGPDILLMDDYETADVIITAYVTNGTQFNVHHTKCQFDDKIISWTGPNNKKNLVWTDICGDTWKVQFIVPGIRRPLQIDVIYIGEMKYLDDKVEDDELVVTIHYLTDYYDEEREILQPGEWFWQSLNIIRQDNDGVMRVGWSKDYVYTSIHLSANTRVPYISLIDTTLIAWYEGPDIEVGNLFNKSHVVVYLCPPDEDRIRLHYYTEGIIMEISEITKVGDNWYNVIFIKNGYKLTARYAVPGVIYKEYPNPDFQVWYVVKDSLPGMPQEIDLTELFRPYFTFRGEFVITWEQFLKRVYDFDHKDETPYYGMFGITAPKMTGLYGKYASTWHVYCFDDHTLKAEIYKLYDTPISKKEDNDDGSKKDNDKENSGKEG